MPNSEEVMLTNEQMKRLAEIVCPGEDWHIFGDTVAVAWPTENTGALRFNPSLAGEDWQQAQALRVIVAAMSLPSMMNVHRYSNGYAIEYWSGMEGRETPVCPDILQTCIMALLHGAES